MIRCAVCDSDEKELVVCGECYNRVTGELQKKLDRMKDENAELRRQLIVLTNRKEY